MIDFPNNPNVGDEFEYQGNTWVWDGTAWVLKQASGTIGWDDVTDKPTEFPPEPHTHTESHITDLDKYSQAEADVKFVDVSGDTMTGFLALHADPTLDAHAATKRYVDNVGGGGVTDHGALTGLANDDHLQYHTDARGDARYVNITGDTMTGFLALHADPTLDAHAATKKYVDDNSGVTDHGALTGLADDDHLQYHTDARGDARYVNITGDTMTGFLNLSADPTLALHAATKQYVDNNSGGGVTDHGDLTGLTDDDHPQYHNDVRGDARYVNLTGDTMTGLLEIANAGNPGLRVTKGATQIGIGRIDLAHDDGVGGYNLGFRIQNNRQASTVQTLLRAYNVDDNQYIQLNFEPHNQEVSLTISPSSWAALTGSSLLNKTRADTRYGTVADATTFAFNKDRERYTRFLEDHGQYGIDDLNDLSPTNDPDWPYNQFMVRISTAALPANGFPNMGAGDFICSHSWGGSSAFQNGWDTTTTKQWLRTKSGDVWSDWVDITVGSGGGLSHTVVHDVTGVASYRLIESTLECWGTDSTASASRVITFPQEYVRPPTVTATIDNAAVGTWSIDQVSGTGFTVRTADAAGVDTALPIAWYAIGEEGMAPPVGTMSVENIGEEPVIITDTDGPLSTSIELGNFAGGYTTRITDGAPLTTTMVTADTTAIARPTIDATAGTDLGDVLVATNALWLYEGADKGDQTGQWLADGVAIPNETGLTYAITADAQGKDVTYSNGFGGNGVTSLPVSVPLPSEVIIDASAFATNYTAPSTIGPTDDPDTVTIDFGAATTGRRLYVFSMGLFGSTPTCTIDGINAPLIEQQIGAGNTTVALFALDSDTIGGSVDVVFTTTGRLEVSHYGVAARNFTSATVQEASANGTASIVANVADEGAVIAAGFNNNGSTTTWIGITKEFDQDIRSDEHASGGTATLLAANASYPVSATPAVTNTQALMTVTLNP